MPIKMTLFKKYALAFGIVNGLLLLTSGMFSISYSYQEHKQAIIRLQREKAEAAALRIGQYLFDIEQRLGNTVPPKKGISALEQRSEEIQYLRRIAAINEIVLLDYTGREYLRVSRRASDIVRSGKDFSSTDYFQQASSGNPYRSPIYFRDGFLYMTLAMAAGPKETGVTVVEINLEFLLDGITQIKVGDSGHAYAVNTEGILIAHPEIGLVLKKTSFAELPQVKAAIRDRLNSGQNIVEGRDIDGKKVLTAFGAIPQLGWFVFVEEPLAEAYSPLYDQIIRGALMILAGIIFSVFVSVAIVRRMVKPLHELQNGAALIGRGVLDHHISIHTGDELEELASEFNNMAEQLHKSYATLEMEVAKRTSELEDANSQLASLSATDSLTGLANRRNFDEVWEAEWQRAVRQGQRLAIAMIDVDFFKLYNDHYGHQAGDECLKLVAHVLTTSVQRSGELVARYGGEEFVAILPGLDETEAYETAQRIRAAVESQNICHSWGTAAGVVTVSIGVASRVPRMGDNPSSLLQEADKALYRAKHEGRNRILMA